MGLIFLSVMVTFLHLLFQEYVNCEKDHIHIVVRVPQFLYSLELRQDRCTVSRRIRIGGEISSCITGWKYDFKLQKCQIAPNSFLNSIENFDKPLNFVICL